MCLLASRVPHPPQCQVGDATLQNLQQKHPTRLGRLPSLYERETEAAGCRGESRILPNLPNRSAAKLRGEARFPESCFCSAPTSSSSPGRTHSIIHSWTPTRTQESSKQHAEPRIVKHSQYWDKCSLPAASPKLFQC